MANEKVYAYRNAGTENSPLWEKYFNRTVADAVQMDADDPTTIKEYVDNRLSLLSDENAELKQQIDEKLDEMNLFSVDEQGRVCMKVQVEEAV